MSDNWYQRQAAESAENAKARKTAEFTDFMERTTGEVPELVHVVKDPAADHVINKAIAGLFKPGSLTKDPI